MKIFVIAKNLKYFWNHIQDRFMKDEILKAEKNIGRVLLKSGDELNYLSSQQRLRGLHNANIELWSMPEWFNFEVEKEIKRARLP